MSNPNYGVWRPIAENVEFNALESNSQAVMAVAETVRTTLGPKGLDKLLIDQAMNRHVSNDGHREGHVAVDFRGSTSRLRRRRTDVSSRKARSIAQRTHTDRRPIRQSPGPGLQSALHQGAAQNDRRAGQACD